MCREFEIKNNIFYLVPCPLVFFRQPARKDLSWSDYDRSNFDRFYSSVFCAQSVGTIRCTRLFEKVLCTTSGHSARNCYDVVTDLNLTLSS